MISMNLDKALKMRDREIVCSKERKRERERELLKQHKVNL